MEAFTNLVMSRYGFAETVQRLRAAIEAAGQTVFAVLDQASAAADAGTSLRPTILIIFGNPKGGSPVMEAWPVTGLELPLKFLIWQDEEGVTVAYFSMAGQLQTLGAPKDEPHVAAMDAVLKHLVKTVT